MEDDLFSFLFSLCLNSSLRSTLRFSLLLTAESGQRLEVFAKNLSVNLCIVLTADIEESLLDAKE